MRVLHLLDLPWWSGLSAYAFDCMRAHRESGHEVLLACERGSLVERKAEERGFAVLPIGGRDPWNSFRNWLRMGGLVMRHRPDAVIAHTGSTHWIAWVWGRSGRFKIIRTRATSQRAKPTALNKRIYSESRWIVTASDRLRRDALELLRLPSDRFRALAPPASPLHSPEIAAEAPSLGMLARLDPVKGHGHLIEAARRVQSAFPNLSIHLAGSEEGVRWHELRKQARALGLRNVTYHGFLPQERVGDFLLRRSLGVIASTGSEEVSRALLEWMIAGKPVVATRVGCMEEFSRGAEGVRLVPPADAAAMSQAILEFLEDPAQAREAGEKNRRFCHERYSPENFRREWEALLRS